MRKHILVAYDESPQGHAALEVGVELAREVHARLTLAHVVEHPEDEPVEACHALAHELLGLDPTSSWRGRLATIAATTATEVEVDVRIGTGDTAPSLLTMINETEAELVVAGSSGSGAMRRVLRGSVSAFLVRHAPCPVLLIGTQAVARQRRTDATIAERESADESNAP